MHSNLSVILFILYSYVNHNYLFIFYALGLLLSVILCIYRPNRFLILLALGFAILCFAFQYDKHFALQASDEIIKTIQSKNANTSLEKIDIFFSTILPITFYLIGWVTIFISITLEALRKNHN